MKTTIEINELTFRRAKAFAASNGLTLKEFFTTALEEHLQNTKKTSRATQPPWMKGFGGLSDLKHESRRVMKLIDEEFEQVEPGDRT